MIGPTDLLHPSPTPHFKTFQVFLIYCPKRPNFVVIRAKKKQDGGKKNCDFLTAVDGTYFSAFIFIFLQLFKNSIHSRCFLV
jgi:hypothetical protein